MHHPLNNAMATIINIKNVLSRLWYLCPRRPLYKLQPWKSQLRIWHCLVMGGKTVDADAR